MENAHSDSDNKCKLIKQKTFIKSWWKGDEYKSDDTS